MSWFHPTAHHQSALSSVPTHEPSVRRLFRSICPDFATHPGPDRVDPKITNVHIRDGYANRHFEWILQCRRKRCAAGPVFPQRRPDDAVGRSLNGDTRIELPEM